VQTDGTIRNDKPDIIIRDNEKGTRVLNYVAISGGRNVIKKEVKNFLRYKNITIEVLRMRNLKTKVIPATIGANGTISKSPRQYLCNIPGKHDINELQKTPILGTTHLLRKVLM
jgi:hypothetical protein